jgi:hypothetical protein
MPFGTVLRRPELRFVDLFALAPAFQKVNAVVDFQLPDTPVNPIAYLATTTELVIHERAMDVVYARVVAKAHTRTAPDELLPECTCPSGSRVCLQLERTLKTDIMQQVSEKERP